MLSPSIPSMPLKAGPRGELAFREVTPAWASDSFSKKKHLSYSLRIYVLHSSPDTPAVYCTIAARQGSHLFVFRDTLRRLLDLPLPSRATLIGKSVTPYVRVRPCLLVVSQSMLMLVLLYCLWLSPLLDTIVYYWLLLLAIV